MNFDNEFAGKRVVITGADGIIGRMLVEHFLAEGAIVCSTDKSADQLEGFAVSADLTTDFGLQKLLESVSEEWGAPHIVVNNAGIYPSSFLLDMQIEDWDQIMGVNVRAPFALMRGFSLQMIREEIKGSFVNISSGAARKMRRTAVTYCMSKTALDRMSKGFALELAEYGIRVNCLEPGFAKGSSVSHLSEEHIEQVLASIPLGGEISKNDIGHAALYLASSAARNVTGTTLSVDGGNSAGTMNVYQEKKRAL